jgi:hypothetical protein
MHNFLMMMCHTCLVETGLDKGSDCKRKRTKRIKASDGELEGKLQYLSQYLRERNISNKKQERYDLHFIGTT